MGKPQIHPRFMVFQLGPAGKDAAEGNGQGGIEEKGKIRMTGEAVEVAEPGAVTPPHGIAGKGGVDSSGRTGPGSLP